MDNMSPQVNRSMMTSPSSPPTPIEFLDSRLETMSERIQSLTSAMQNNNYQIFGPDETPEKAKPQAINPYPITEGLVPGIERAFAILSQYLAELELEVMKMRERL